jgi:hypothetical protein
MKIATLKQERNLLRTVVRVQKEASNVECYIYFKYPFRKIKSLQWRTNKKMPNKLQTNWLLSPYSAIVNPLIYLNILSFIMYLKNLTIMSFILYLRNLTILSVIYSYCMWVIWLFLQLTSSYFNWIIKINLSFLPKITGSLYYFTNNVVHSYSSIYAAGKL